LGVAQLCEASKKGDVAAVKLLLARNVDVNKAYKVRGEFGQRGRRGRQWNGAKRLGWR
jgi:hypothetical protein